MFNLDDESFYAHHLLPTVFGGTGVGEFVELVLVSVDREAARKPITPGLPPLQHLTLPAPEEYQVVVPIPVPEPEREPRITSERVRFPVARPPAFRSLSPAPAVPVEPPAPRPPEPASTIPAAPAAVPVPSATDQPAQTVEVAIPAFARRFDPVYAFLLYLALCIGTLYINLDNLARYTILWTALVAIGTFLTLVDSEGEPFTMTSVGLGWGVAFGALFSLPLLILVSSGLADMSAVLFGDISRSLLFQSLAFLGPLGETVFFRGTLQERRGITFSVIGAGIGGLLLFWPAAAARPVYLIAAGIFSTVLAGVYSFVRTRHGLVAAYICQVTVNLLLLFVPGIHL